MKMRIDFDKLNDFCEKNDFILINEDEVENMFFDLAYKKEDNFVGRSVYPIDMPIIINKNVWEKLKRINKELNEKGFALKIVDCYRPIYIQHMFWNYYFDIHGEVDETLIANPNKYGTHNIKINAVDYLLVDLNGNLVDLPCEFDDFSGKSFINYDGCTDVQKENRDLLINVSKKYGMIVNESEWWHYIDESIADLGLRYNYSTSDLVPVGDKEVFYFEDNL